MSEVTQHTIANTFENVLNAYSVNEWMHRLWAWADENHLDEEDLPRQMKPLLQLKTITLFLIFSSIGQSIESKTETHPISKSELTEKERAELVQRYVDETYTSATVINKDAYLPKELGMLTQLEELCIGMNPIQSLPDEITNLKYLKKLCLCHNVNLVLTNKQKEWVRILENNGAEVSFDERLLEVIL